MYLYLSKKMYTRIIHKTNNSQSYQKVCHIQQLYCCIEQYENYHLVVCHLMILVSWWSRADKVCRSLSRGRSISSSKLRRRVRSDLYHHRAICITNSTQIQTLPLTDKTQHSPNANDSHSNSPRPSSQGEVKVLYSKYQGHNQKFIGIIQD